MARALVSNVILSFAALPCSAYQEGSAVEEVRWPLGLRAIRSADVPRRNLFGNKAGWIGRPGEKTTLVSRSGALPSFEVEANGASLEIEIRRSTGFENDYVHLWLSPSGAQATASSSCCTAAWIQPHLAGSACIVTDGTTGALEFEIYDGMSAEHANRYFGRVYLDAPAVELANAIDARTDDKTGIRLERFTYQPPRDPFLESLYGEQEAEERRPPALEIFGYVDAWGRRQGLWHVRDADSKATVLEMNWRNGIPDGAYHCFESEWILSSVGNFDMGFESGQSVHWRRSGERIVHDWSRFLTPDITLYDSEGQKISEWTSKVTRRWSSDGVLIEEKANPRSDRTADSLSMRANLARFHTRQ